MDTPLEQRIRLRAYEIWQYRQSIGEYLIVDRRGNIREIDAQDNWLEAESEIRDSLNDT